MIQIQIDELTEYYGMKPTDYEAVRCGMSASKAITEGTIDTGIGLENVKMVELEEWLAEQGRPRSDVQMLRIDELASLDAAASAPSSSSLTLPLQTTNLH